MSPPGRSLAHSPAHAPGVIADACQLAFALATLSLARGGDKTAAMTLSAFLFQALNGLSSASGLFLVAVGLSLIFGVTRIINIAHGSLYMLGTYIAYSIATRIGGGLGYWGAHDRGGARRRRHRRG